jgi:hypothetical protein
MEMGEQGMVTDFDGRRSLPNDRELQIVERCISLDRRMNGL